MSLDSSCCFHRIKLLLVMIIIFSNDFSVMVLDMMQTAKTVIIHSRT